MPLNKWDHRFLEVARIAADWSKDPNVQVGAVIVDAQGQIAGVGYNGFPIRVEDSVERLEDKEIKNEMIVHAEENAVLGAGTRARDGTIQARLTRVVAQRPKEGTDSHWDKVGLLALAMLAEAKVEFEPTSD